MVVSGGSRCLCVVSALVVATSARADMMPEDGTRSTDYGFRVDDISAFPDYVVLAYPWSLSNGAPTYEHTVVKPGEVVRVGRRSDDPGLYAMRRAEFEAWTASHAPDAEDYEPQRQALFASGKVMRCGATVSPTHDVPADYQGEVLDVFRAESIDARSCKIVAVPAKSLRPSASEPPVTRPAAGCRSGDGGPGYAMLALVLLGLRRRR